MTIKNAMLNYAYYGAEETPTEPETTQPSNTEPETIDPNTSEPDESEPPDNWVLVDEVVATEGVDESQPYIRTSSSYNTGTYPGNYVVSEIDEAGNTTTYANDGDGNVTEIIDGRGNSTSYSYDIHNNLTSVSATVGEETVSNTYTYNSYNELSKITHNGFDYNYTYNNFGEPSAVKVNSQELISYTYDSNGNITKATYGNGDYLDYTYDDYARLINVKLNNTTDLATYVYNKKGLVTRFTDGKSGEVTDYAYDCHGNTMSILVASENGTLLKNLSGDIEKTKINGREYTIENGTDEQEHDFIKCGDSTITTITDDFDRVSSVTSSGYELNYTYKGVTGSNATTKLVNTMTYELDEDDIAQYTYDYDSNGNITEVKEGNTVIAKYTYDELNQLSTSADENANEFVEYIYDANGNITQKKVYSLTTSMEQGTLQDTIAYNYDSNWKDKLVSYDGDSISYDAIGNPTSYRDGITMTWQNGRELASLSKTNGSDTDTYSFKYNLNGLRTEKNINGTKTYYYHDSNNNLIGMKKGADTVLFYYDSDGGLVSMSVQGSGSNPDTTYLFVKNLQGDITKILDDSGDEVATYTYDAWGKIINETEDNAIAGLNPFRYRGYIYDPETELYYLQSRYYDPLTGRFLNADDPDYTDTYSGSPLSTNMFAYCENNPVSGYDPTGNWDYSEHARICRVYGFTPLVQRWTTYPDIYFKSRDDYVGGTYNKQTYCSAPFHSRASALEITKYIYNKAIDVKKSSKKIKFYLSSDETKKNKTGCLYIKYFGYRLKNEKNKPLTIDNNMSKELKDMLNALDSPSKQSKALLGLALHTVQDYFAHSTLIYYSTDKQKLKKLIKIGDKSKQITTTDFSNNILGNTKIFEDKRTVFSWRFENTKKVTKRIYNLYYNNKKIKNIRAREYGEKNIIKSYTLLGKKYYFNTVKYRINISQL